MSPNDSSLLEGEYVNSEDDEYKEDDDDNEEYSDARSYQVCACI